VEDADGWEEALARLTWATATEVAQGSAAFLRALTPAGPVDVFAQRPQDVLDWAARLGALAAPRPSDDATFRAAATRALGAPTGGPIGILAVRHLTGDGELR
jgi:hypothetical protein